MNNAEILIIDDEPQIRKLLNITLESNGYKVREAATGRDGIIQAASHPPDLILLDLALPDQSGHEVLRNLRTWYGKPVIILSVNNGEEDVVTALDLGATDYLSKPFRSAELLARIRSAIRRNTDSTAKAVIESGNLTIDLSARTASKNGKPLKLTATEFSLLALFARNAGRVLTHQYILKEIWGVAYQSETQYLRVFVGTLRKKIEDNPNSPALLVTESGIGYRFV
ncbi:MAG: response regulator transcription factor [Bacteroidia bacterium]|jgi:two-component system KDP operon response regulator KdpE|nr:response regulator transcription factor [Bacteroidia bacterium]